MNLIASSTGINELTVENGEGATLKENLAILMNEK